MINKLEFNNLVVTNKKKILLIKTKTIQKLVQKIKKLKYLLDKNPEHEKNKERLRKATLCLEELKKLKCIALMKLVLILEKSPSAILTNGLSLPDEMAVAMVATNKGMQELVNIFTEKLRISNENKNWKKELMQASKKQIKTIKTEKKRNSRKALKEQKAMARKRTEWLRNQNGTQNVENINEQNDNIALEENDDGANVSTLGYWKIEEIEDKPSVKQKKEVLKEVTTKAVTSKEQQSKKGKKSQDISLNIVKRDEQILSKSKPVENRSITNNSNQEPESLPPYPINLEDDSVLEKTIEENVTHVIDPFFITDSGENYRSSAVVVRNGKITDPEISNKNVDNESLRHYRGHSKQEKFNAREKYSHQTVRKGVKENKPEALHPSWAAKQKLNNVIGSFQGKKIKFDDDDNHVEQTSINTNSKAFSIESQNKNHVSTHRRKNEHNEKALHPSWAAKKKFNVSKTNFMGKKITFGDDEVLKCSPERMDAALKLESLNTSTELHPSWVAKQKQKPTIITFQGKKTTFEDD